MPATPWRIAAQSYTVLDPETKEPAFTLSFIVDHGQADMMKLRMTPSDGKGAALEMQFSTGGYVVGEPMKQPRWLKAFERPEPQYLSDKAFGEFYDALPEASDGTQPDKNGDVLSEEQRVARQKYEPYRKRREEWEKVNGVSDEQLPAGQAMGPDNTDPNSPEAQAAQAKRAGIGAGASDADRKGTVSQPPGGMAGETATMARDDARLAPNAQDQQLQKQGKPVDADKGVDKGGKNKQDK